MLRPRVSVLTCVRSFVQRNHPTYLGSTRPTSTAISSTLPARSRNHRTRYLFLGISAVSATGYLLYQHKVYADAHTDGLPRHFESQLPLPGLTPGLRDVAWQWALTTTPGEGRIAITYYPLSTTLGYLCIGVYDGHNGASTVVELANNLSGAVVSTLADLYSQHVQKHAAMDVSSGIYLPAPSALPNPIPPDDEIDAVIRNVFMTIDVNMVHNAARKVLGLDTVAYAVLQGWIAYVGKDPLPVTSASVKPPHHLQESVRALSSAWSGSCALLGIFNVDDRSLRVALTGDSRAVLGRRVSLENGDYTYEAHALTTDQTATNSALLTTLHPDEPDLPKNDRVVGRGPSRVFGDGSMKWSRAVQAQLHEKVLGDKPRDACTRPPYFTADPVVTTTRDVRRGDFVVFATAGLWNCLTNEEVDRDAEASVVGKEGETHAICVPLHGDLPVESNSGFGSISVTTAAKPSNKKDTVPAPASPPTTPSKTYLSSELPVVFPPSYEDKTTMYKAWRAEKNFICEDEQVAVHLMRNALGGANKGLALALLEMPMPRARRYRDDISIVVIFFE